DCAWVRCGEEAVIFQEPTAARGTSPRILLVEDHEDTRHVYGLVLRHMGFQVEEVVSGDQVLARAHSLSPDLILMDIGLPVIDGWEAARRLKASEATATIPLVAFSALIDCVADLRSDTSVFDGFISKPVSPSELVRRVRAYLDLTNASGRQ